jgi:hypothetical protein
MKLPMNWLKRYVNIDGYTPQDIQKALTLRVWRSAA